MYSAICNTTKNSARSLKAPRKQDCFTIRPELLKEVWSVQAAGVHVTEVQAAETLTSSGCGENFKTSTKFDEEESIRLRPASCTGCSAGYHQGLFLLPMTLQKSISHRKFTETQIPQLNTYYCDIKREDRRQSTTQMSSAELNQTESLPHSELGGKPPVPHRN